MTVHKIKRLQPNLLNHNALASNGQIPGAAFWARLARAANHWALRQKKTFLSVSDDYQALDAGVASTITVAYACGATGHGTSKLVALIGMVPPQTSIASDPYVEMKSRAHGESSFTSHGEIHYYGKVPGATPRTIYTSALQWDCSANTHYEFKLERNDYTRIAYVVIGEMPSSSADDTERGIVDPTQFVGEGDIEDAAVQDLVDAVNDLQRHNRAHLYGWSRTYDDWPSTTSSSYTGMVSNGVAHFDLANHDYENARGVPVVFGANVQPNGGKEGSIRLRNTTDGSTVAEITNMVPTTDSDWIKTSARITPSDIDGDDLEIQIKSDGTNSFEVRGVTLYEYEYDWSPTLAASADLENSSTQYLKITNAAQNKILDVRTNLTIECWVKFESTPSSGNAMILVAKWDSSRSYDFFVVNDSGTPKLVGGVSDDGTNAHQAEVDWTPSTGTWYHVAMVFDPQASGGTPKDQITFYIDSSAQTSVDRADDGATSINNGTADFTIGALGDDTSHLDGKICDVRLWREIRTSAQISANYNRDVQLHAGLVGHWIKTDLTTDETDHGNDLTEVNSPSTSSDVPY